MQNVSDREQMQTVVDEVVAKYGTINGVVHAAGVVQAGMIQTKTRESANAVLAPKVYGTMILFDLLKRIKLDFMVLFSSVSSAITPYALSDYTAANSFLDAFAFFANAKGFPALTINWSLWKEVGMLAELENLQGVGSWDDAGFKNAITNKEGLEVFERALNSNLAQVIVSPEDLNQLIEAAGANRDLHEARTQQDKAAQPTNTVEAALADMWSAVFGIDGIGIHEHFSDLGGHSLLAMQIVSRIHSLYQIPFTLRDFFEAPTIAQLGSVIEGRILGEVEGLTDEQAHRLIAND